MEKVEVTRNGDTDEFSIVLAQGGDSIRCMVTVSTGIPSDERRRAALSKAKGLAKALDAAIEAS